MKVKRLVFQELQKLELVVEKLRGDPRNAPCRLPNIDLMRKKIHLLTKMRGLDADYLQIVEKALKSACTEEYIIAYPEQRHLTPGGGMTPELKFFHQHLLGNVGDGRLDWVYFRTGNTLGTGLPSARSGDEIWFLHGASAPVILRPLLNGSYRFMGEAYVHGVMYGEAGAQCETHRVINIE